MCGSYGKAAISVLSEHVAGDWNSSLPALAKKYSIVGMSTV